MMKLPYGLADFHSLITDGYVYLDRTHHLRTLEDLGRALLFVRPRRFGKSLWLRTLATYYDLRYADQHEEIFGGLHVGREPTPLAHRYFVLVWNFSKVHARDPGSTADLGRRLDEHVNSTIRTFSRVYRDHLPDEIPIDANPITTLDNLLARVSETPYRLYLLIDEYDNFANELLVSDGATYRDLVRAEGPFRQLMKAVKAAMEGEGLERLFLTGVTPVVLSDLTSGFNIGRNISLEPELEALCGFTDSEVRGLLEAITEEREKRGDAVAFHVEEAADMLRTWYNGYRFSIQPGEAVYNPTLALYFLDHLLRQGTYPRRLLDRNLAADQQKLRYLARTSEGKEAVVDLIRTGEPLEVDAIEERFSPEDMLRGLREDTGFLASFLYYFGMLTLREETAHRTLRLQVPNLVIRKLYADEVLRFLVEDEQGEEISAQQVASHAPVQELMRKGVITPLLRFVEREIFPRFSLRDARWVNELTLKTLFLTLLFDDLSYVLLSEPELGRGYADLCLLRRPDARSAALWDLLIEFKSIPIKTLGMSREELADMDEETLAAHPVVAAALEEGTRQVRRYRDGLVDQYGDGLRLRELVVVGVGFERLVGSTHSG